MRESDLEESSLLTILSTLMCSIFAALGKVSTVDGTDGAMECEYALVIISNML